LASPAAPPLKELTPSSDLFFSAPLRERPTSFFEVSCYPFFCFFSFCFSAFYSTTSDLVSPMVPQRVRTTLCGWFVTSFPPFFFFFFFFLFEVGLFAFFGQFAPFSFFLSPRHFFGPPDSCPTRRVIIASCSPALFGRLFFPPQPFCSLLPPSFYTRLCSPPLLVPEDARCKCFVNSEVLANPC